jgi:pyruvate-ferredoxin/flavodoxin oxidoreductase
MATIPSHVRPARAAAWHTPCADIADDMTNDISGTRRWITVDGNEAVARVAYKLSDVIAIYPITPSSTMGEWTDQWATQGATNLWSTVPAVVELQSEAGAAGALHGALQTGALGTTFTASQGLLVMLPNLYKIAGELTPAVIHVAARAVATHALSIFGDHSDVMAARPTGWVLLSSASVQEAQDLALVAHAATLRCRLPFLHFFDGFRTSHEVAKIQPLTDDDLRALVDESAVLAHRARGLDPDAPVLRGSAQNPDVFFQSREAANPVYDAVPAVVQQVMDELAARTGRPYHLADYRGAPDAERVLVLMGSAAGAAGQAVDELVARGEKVGVLTVHLFRPFPIAAVLDALPATVQRIAVLDRTKEPGSAGEPLYQDVVTALAEGGRRADVVGVRYGLASKELTPAMAKAALDELALDPPLRRRHVTVGIEDDVTHLSLAVDRSFAGRGEADNVRALLYGLGSDGTVGASKRAVKVVGEETDRFAQGYFEYDSKKSGSVTVSHLRFGPRPIESTYLVDDAAIVVASQFAFTARLDLLGRAAEGATVLLNSPYPADETWDRLPVPFQEQVLAKRARLFVIDATMVARRVGLGGRTNAVLLPCFLSLAAIMPEAQMLAALKRAVAKDFAERGDDVVAANVAAIEGALGGLEEVRPGAVGSGAAAPVGAAPAAAGFGCDAAFVERVTTELLAGHGDALPVSALPADGTYPTGTARLEKRGLADELPVWDADVCIDCGKCTVVCPHAAIRMKVYAEGVIDAGAAPDGFVDKPFRSKDLAGHRLAIQVSPDDCTGCGLCVEACPAHTREEPVHRALELAPAAERAEVDRPLWAHFTTIPELDRRLLPHDSVKGSQVLQPLFEFSGACSGCGETPYLKLLSQLFGDHLLVANATGCSSIYGGNLPTTPWTVDANGRGPAWANSLFEDNAEFGLGIRIAYEQQRAEARALLSAWRTELGAEAVDAVLDGLDAGEDEAALQAQRARVEELASRFDRLPSTVAARLRSLQSSLTRKSLWIVGGDGWAYDIGSAGLDHVLASGRDVNILVLDTEVYSNTGGQASKATPRAAMAKFASSGKVTPKKDLAMIAASYGNVYVAEVAIGANDLQTTKALLEADAWDGPSIVIAYSTCIAHGIDMATSMTHQKEAVKSGYWPLFRFHPEQAEHGHPFQLDSKAPSMPVRDFCLQEERFGMLAGKDADLADRLLELAQDDVDERWHYYEQLAAVERTAPHAVDDEDGPPPPGR